jgi:hypothetical protein
MRSAKSIQPAKACRRSPYRARHHQLDDPTRRDSRCHRTKRRSKATLIRLINGLEETTEGRVGIRRPSAKSLVVSRWPLPQRWFLALTPRSMDDRFHRGGADCRPDSARSPAAPLLWFCPRMTQFVGRNRARCCTCDDQEHCARHVRGDSSCRLAGSLYQSKPTRCGIGTATLFASAAARNPPGWPHPTRRAVGAA